MLENKKLNSGITLLALVVTIILLLIIAGISIASIGGENSIINKEKKPKMNMNQLRLKNH